MSHLLPAARGCRGGAKVLWHWAMWRSTVMSHTPQPRVPRSTLPRARQLPPGQERGVADCVLVDPVLLHLVPSRHLQQPSGERRSSVSRGGKRWEHSVNFLEPIRKHLIRRTHSRLAFATRRPGRAPFGRPCAAYLKSGSKKQALSPETMQTPRKHLGGTRPSPEEVHVGCNS